MRQEMATLPIFTRPLHHMVTSIFFGQFGVNSKLMTRQILICFSILIIVSCGQPKPLNENERAIVIDEVRRTLDNYYDDIRKSGLTAEFKYLDNSVDFFWVPPGYSLAISYDSVATVLKQNASKFKFIDNTFDTLRITPIRKELATYTGRLHSTMTDTSNKVLTFEMVETGVLIKRKEGWKLLCGQTSILDK